VESISGVRGPWIDSQEDSLEEGDLEVRGNRIFWEEGKRGS
jgi:hypothetical protein